MSILPQLILNSIIAGSIYTLVALGFSLIYSATKFFNLSHGAVAAAGGYAVFFLTQHFGLNMYPAVLLGVLFAGILGFALDKFIFLPLRKKKASTMILLVASLGAFTAIQAILAMLFTSQFQTLSNLIPNQKIYQIFGGAITQTQVAILISGLLILLGLVVLLKKTKLGHAILAIADDEEVAKIVGINTNQVIGYVFFIGSAIAGLAGIFMGFDTGIEPTMGLPLLLNGIIGVIIGGISNLYGAVLGCFLLGFAENFGIWQISGEWKSAIAFGLLIVFLLFRPRGIIQK